MPEGIEIACMATDLNKVLIKKELAEFQMNSHYLKRVGDEYKEFCKLLPLKVQKVSFKGKIIIFDMGKAFFTSQLGMSGKWGSKISSHTHLNLRFQNDKNKNFWLHYTDVRRFGMVRFYPGAEGKKALEKKLNSIAPDFLSEYKISETVFTEKVLTCRERTFLGKLLMDQSSICSGVGNYILSELFYRCRLHPFTRIYDLSREDISGIYQELKAIMFTGFINKGTSVQDYYNLDGKKGNYQSLLQVYMKMKDPLGNRIEREVGPHNRTIHWVSKIQTEKKRVLVLNPDSASVEGQELGFSLLFSAYRKECLKLINGDDITITKLSQKYALEETAENRPHIILNFGNEETLPENPFLERVFVIDV